MTGRAFVLAGLIVSSAALFFVLTPRLRAGTIVKSGSVSVSAIVGSYNPGDGGTGGSSGGGGGAGFITFPTIIDPPGFFPEFTIEDRPRICSRIADYNCDGLVNIIDFSILIYWFDRRPVPEDIDLTNDGRVDLRDFSVMAYYWHE